jgi:hypothetical protein
VTTTTSPLKSIVAIRRLPRSSVNKY